MPGFIDQINVFQTWSTELCNAYYAYMWTNKSFVLKKK